MTSPLVACLNQVTTDLEAATPPTDTNLPYREVEGNNEPAGTAGHRKFWYGLPERGEPTEENQNATLVTYSVPLRLRLDTSGMSMRNQVDAMVNEGSLLMRTLEKRTTWPAGVNSVLTENMREDDEDESDDTIALMNLRISVWENQ